MTTSSQEQRGGQPTALRNANAQMRQSRASVTEQRAASQDQRDKNKLDAMRRGIADAQTFLRSEEVRVAIASVSLPQLIKEQITRLIGPEAAQVGAQEVSSAGKDRSVASSPDAVQDLPIRPSRVAQLAALEQTLKDLQKSALTVSAVAASKQEGTTGVRNG